MLSLVSIFLCLYLFIQFYELYELYEYYDFDVSKDRIADSFNFRVKPISQRIGKTLLFLCVSGPIAWYFLKRGETVVKMLLKKH